MNKITEMSKDNFKYESERKFSDAEDSYLEKAQEKIFKIIDEHPNQKQLEWVYYDVVQEVLISTMNHFQKNENTLFLEKQIKQFFA